MIAKLIADTSSAIFCKDNMIPIPVYWTDNHNDNINIGIISNIESMKNQSVEVTSPIKSISEHLPQNVEPTSTIPMTWKDDSLRYSDQGTEIGVLNVIDKDVDQVSNERNFENVTAVDIQNERTENEESRRHRKCPIRRSDDFFCGTNDKQ